MTKEEKEDLVKEKRQALADAHQKADEAFAELIKVRASIDERVEAFRQLEEAKANSIVAKSASMAQDVHQETGIADLRLAFEETKQQANETMLQSRAAAASQLEAAKVLHDEAWNAAGAIYDAAVQSAEKTLGDGRVKFDAALMASRDIANYGIATSQKSVESFRDAIAKEDEEALKRSHACHEAVHQAELELIQAEQTQ